MTLDVCLDQALTGWIMSFGPFARVIAPATLAQEIAGQFERGRALYKGSLEHVEIARERVGESEGRSPPARQ
jgi:hypothetical protein